MWRCVSPAAIPTARSCYRHHNIDGEYSFSTKVGNTSLVDAVASWALGLPGPTRLIDTRQPLKCQ